MVVFTIDNIKTHADNADEIMHAVDKYLMIHQDGFVKEVDWKKYKETGRTQMRTRHKRNTIRLYNPMAKTFPTGRLGYICEWCKENNVQYQIVDNRKKPDKKFNCKYIGPPSDGSTGYPPRPYQKTCPEKVEKIGRGVLWHATASGKTITGARIIQKLGVKTLYMVPSKTLLHQTYEDIREVLSGVEIGVCGDGKWDPKDITIATTATLWSRYEKEACKELINNTELLIADECHHVQSSGTRDKQGQIREVNSWYVIAINCPAYYRIGLTGTPGKDIEQKRSFLESAFGRVIDRVSARQLIDLGVIADVDIHIHKIKHKETATEYATARKNVILNPEFNRYVVDVAIQELESGKNVLLLTNSKKYQGPMLCREFKRRGYEVPFVSGSSNNKSRKKAREDFKNGDLKCLIGTIYKEGVNFPKCDCGILCDGGYDEKKTIQFLGRILRKGKKAKTSTLHDFFHKDSRHLEKHSNNRIKTYMEEELDSIIMHDGISINSIDPETE